MNENTKKNLHFLFIGIGLIFILIIFMFVLNMNKCSSLQYWDSHQKKCINKKDTTNL